MSLRWVSRHACTFAPPRRKHVWHGRVAPWASGANRSGGAGYPRGTDRRTESGTRDSNPRLQPWQDAHRVREHCGIRENTDETRPRALRVVPQCLARGDHRLARRRAAARVGAGRRGCHRRVPVGPRRHTRVGHHGGHARGRRAPGLWSAAVAGAGPRSESRSATPRRPRSAPRCCGGTGRPPGAAAPGCPRPSCGSGGAGARAGPPDRFSDFRSSTWI